MNTQKLADLIPQVQRSLEAPAPARSAKSDNARDVKPREFEQTLKERLIGENKRSQVADGGLTGKRDSIDKINNEIDEKVQKVRVLLKKMGIDVPSEALQDPQTLKKLLAALNEYLKQAENGAVTPSEAPVNVESGAPEAEAVPADLLAELKEGLTLLKGLVELRDFVEKSASAGANNEVLQAVSPEEGAQAGKAVETETTGEESQVKAQAPATATAPASQNSGEAAETKPASTVATDAVKTAPETATQADAETAKTPVPVQADKSPVTQTGSEPAKVLETPETAVTTDNKVETAVKAAPSPKTVSEMKITAASGAVTENAETNENATAPAAVTAAQAPEAGKKKDISKDAPVQIELPAQEKPKEELAAALKKAAHPDGKKAQSEDGNTQQQAQDSGDQAQSEKPLVSKTVADLKAQFAEIITSARVPGQAQQILTAQNARAETPYTDRHGNEKQVVHQIVSKFQILAGHHGTEIQIQLKPEHLGSVKISLEIESNIVFARLEVENTQVKHIVENNLQQLKDSLQQNGIKVESFDVSVAGERNDFFNREMTERGRFLRGMLRMQAEGADGASGRTAAGAETGRRYGYNTVEYVG